MKRMKRIVNAHVAGGYHCAFPGRPNQACSTCGAGEGVRHFQEGDSELWLRACEPCWMAYVLAGVVSRCDDDGV